jgi:hypothetical protein
MSRPLPVPSQAPGPRAKRANPAGCLASVYRCQRPPRKGHSTFEIWVASALLGLTASAALGGVTAARRDATLAALRQTAITLAAERIDGLLTGTGPDEATWRQRVASSLPGGSGESRSDSRGSTVEVRWRAGSVVDSRCPGSSCVALRTGL